MIRTVMLSAAFLAAVSSRSLAGQETPLDGKGVPEGNMERLVLDDMEDISDWSNGTPVETALSQSGRHVKQGRFALRFANHIDHTQGEANYPVGWPRIRKDMAKAKRSDWSGWDYFECWIYAESSRASLPSSPISVGFYHSGRKRSTQFALGQVQLGRWTKIVIPIAKIAEPADVQAVQFNLSESEYRHGDRVDFYIDDMVLTRIVEPTIAEFRIDRRILLASDRHLTASYRVMGRKGMDRVTVGLAIGRDGTASASAAARISPQGEICLVIPQRLAPGDYWARLSLQDAEGKVIDRKQAALRVVEGPF